MAFNINQYLDEIKTNIDEINSKYGSDIDTKNNSIIIELKNDYSNLQNAVKKPNNTHAAYNLIAIITYKLDSIQGILIGLEISKQTAATTELTTNITNANADLKKAQEELKKQIDETAAAEKAAEDLKNEINSLTENATKQQKTIVEFNLTLSKNDEELNRLQEELNKRGDATAISQSQLNEYKEQEAELLNHKLAIENKINSYNVSIESNKRELQTKQAELNTLTTDIENATAMVHEKKKELIEKQTETELLTQEIKKVIEENDKLKEDLKQKQEAYSELIKKTVALGVNIAGLTGQINAAELLKQENEKNKLAAEEELDRINTQKTQAETELAEINNQIAEAENKLKTLQAEISNLEGKKDGLEIGIKDLEDQKYKLIKEKKKLEEQNVTLTANNELLKGQITDFDAQIANLENALKKKNSDLKNVENSILTKKAENKELSQTNDALQNKIKNDIKAYEDGLLDAYAIIKETEDNIASLQKQTADLKKEKDTVTNDLETNKLQIEKSKTEINTLDEQQKILQTKNAYLLLQQTELEATNDAADKELFNTLGAIQINKGIIEGQVKVIGEQEKIITKQKQKITELNKEIDGLEQSRDGLIKILTAKSEELIAAQEKINEIQENLTAKQNELTSKKKELEDIEGREKTLSENEAKLLQRTEELEERAKIQADKETLQAEIERLNAENNVLKQDNDEMLETLNIDERSLLDLDEKVKKYEELLKQKEEEYKRSITELEEQQMVEAKQEFKLLLNNVDVLKADYDTNVNEKTWVKYFAKKMITLDQGLKEYIDSIGTLIDLSKNNKYFNYLTTSIGLDSQEDVDNINRYKEYKDIYENPPPEIPSPPAQEEQTTDELLPPPSSPRTTQQPVKHGEIPKISDVEKIELIKTHLSSPTKNIPDNLLLELYSYAYNNKNDKKMNEFIINTEQKVIPICKTNIINYITKHHDSNSEYKYLIANYLTTNKTDIKDKNIRKSLAEISGSTGNKSDYEEFMTHTASQILLHHVTVAGGGKKTKRNQTYNKKTRRTHK